MKLHQCSSIVTEMLRGEISYQQQCRNLARYVHDGKHVCKVHYNSLAKTFECKNEKNETTTMASSIA